MIENITDWTEATVLSAYRKAQEWMETAGSQLSVGVTEEYDLHIIKFNIKFQFFDDSLFTFYRLFKISALLYVGILAVVCVIILLINVVLLLDGILCVICILWDLWSFFLVFMTFMNC